MHGSPESHSFEKRPELDSLNDVAQKGLEENKHQPEQMPMSSYCFAQSKGG
jgi:hypothetical protein